MDHTRWERLARGEGCPLCAPRPARNEHWDLVAALSISSLYLGTNQTYRGHCQLIFDRRHAATPDQLTPDEWLAFCRDLHDAQAAIVRVVRPDHLNVESLGNVVPHLHWHIVPRYRSDGRWGSPIWLTSLSDMPEGRLTDDDRAELIHRLQTAVAAAPEPGATVE